MFLSASEAEPLDLGSQALAWEPVKGCVPPPRQGGHGSTAPTRWWEECWGDFGGCGDGIG